MIDLPASLLSHWGINSLHIRKEYISLNVVKVIEENKAYYLKRREHSSAEDREEEFFLTKYLLKKGFSVETPLVTESKQSYIKEGNVYYSLYASLNGFSPSSVQSISNSKMKSLGKLLASLHNALASYTSKEELREWDIILSLKKWEKHQCETSIGIGVNDVMGNLEELHFAYRGLSTQLIHSDFHLKNLLFTEDTIGIIDFERLRIAPRIVEIAYFLVSLIRNFIKGVSYEECFQYMHTFMKGYTDINSFTKQERKLLPQLVLAFLLQYTFFYNQKGFTKKVKHTINCIECLQTHEDFYETFKIF